jgi:glc operon protein GlcG
MRPQPGGSNVRLSPAQTWRASSCGVDTGNAGAGTAKNHHNGRKNIMRTSLFTALAVGAGLLIGGQAVAQQAPPEYGLSINLDQAKKAVAAATAEAKKNNWYMAFAVVGPAGDLVYFEKMDNTQVASVAIAQHKARAAATFRRPTKAFQDGLAASPANVYLLTLDGIIASEGGIPILAGGKVIGAIGASGATGAQDGQCAAAGVAALK